MNRRELLISAFFVSWLVFGLNTLATKFYWYSGIWWFDMPMHYFGGALLGILAIIYTKRSILERPILTKSDITLLLGLVLAGAIAWEILEYLFYINGGDAFYFLDSISDLCFGLAGGTTVVLTHILWRNRV
jgi:hypothetical protein